MRSFLLVGLGMGRPTGFYVWIKNKIIVISFQVEEKSSFLMQCFHGLNKEKMHFREWMSEFEQAIISSTSHQLLWHFLGPCDIFMHCSVFFSVSLSLNGPWLQSLICYWTINVLRNTRDETFHQSYKLWACKCKQCTWTELEISGLQSSFCLGFGITTRTPGSYSCDGLYFPSRKCRWKSG